jgi:catechol 2,3-dioxygenase
MEQATIFQIHPATKPGLVSLTVRDVDRSVQFYQHVLGLRLNHAAASSTHLGSLEQGPFLELVGNPQAQAYPQRTGLFHLAILYPGRQALGTALLRLVQAGWRLQGASDHLVSEALYLADPDGNGIELYCDRPKETWPHLNGSLQMDTLPLDIDDLLAQAQTDNLDAPVQACVLGHMHLQVAEIEATEQFYCDVLGFDRVLRYGRSAGFVSAGGYHHHIGFNTWNSAGAAAPPAEALGLRYFTLQLPDEAALGRVKQQLEQAGVAYELSPQGVWVVDPAGNCVLLCVD